MCRITAGRALECRHRENAALRAARDDKGCKDRARVDRGGDTVQDNLAQRMAIDRDLPRRNHGAVLHHTQYRAIALIDDIEVGTVIERRVARPGGTVRIPDDGRQVDRKVQRGGADASNRCGDENLVRRRPGMPRLTTAMVLSNGSLTNNCRITGAWVYPFMITPNRGTIRWPRPALSAARIG